MRIIINKLSISIIISTLLFLSIDIKAILYFSISFAMWFLLFFNFRLLKNLEFFDTVMIIFLGKFATYIIIEIYYYNRLGNEDLFTIVALLAYTAFFLILSLISFSVYVIQKKQPKSQGQNLIPKRKKDLEMLLYYVNMFNVVGLNGRWGTGKSFLISELKKELKDNYEVIEIDLLSCNLDELQLTLIKQLEEVMYKNGLIPKSSNRLKKLLESSSTISKLQGLHSLIIDENKSYSDTLEKFQDELSKLDKKILIIFEDVDRISNDKVIKTIFGISEKLSNSRLKVIYQYYEGTLKDQGFNSEYLEKYIPFKMNLTELDFFEILDFVLKQNKYDKELIEVKDFNFLRDYGQSYRFNVLTNEFGINKEAVLKINYSSIRKVENFLSEVVNIMETKQLKNFKEIVISFFLLKHFMPTIYEKLNIEEGLIKTLKFKWDVNFYTINELIAKQKIGSINKSNIETMFEDEENKLHYSVLKLFNYDVNYQNESKVEVRAYKKRLQLVMEEPVKIITHKNSNEKKDRLIWNLLAHGKSIYTDYEYTGNKFIKEVIEAPSTERIDAYNKFLENLFYNDCLHTDQRTIFKMGIPSFLELFKAFRILNVKERQRIGLVNIYFRINKINHFNIELIQTLNYCTLNTRKEYIYILGKLIKLNIIGNLNSEQCFANFLDKYINALSKLGYIDTSEYFTICYKEKIVNYEKYAIDDLNKIKIRLDGLKRTFKDIDLKRAISEINIIILFINNSTFAPIK